MDIFNYMFEHSIFEGIASARRKFLDTGRMSKKYFNAFVEGDPSSTKKYVEWMCRISEDEAWVNELIIKVIRDFDRLASRGYLKNKDIYVYKTLEDVQKVLEAPKNKEKLKRVSKERALDVDRIKETDTYLIFFPKTYEAVKKYCAHTKWCITTSAEDWEEVVRDGDKCYFVINKVTKRKYAVDTHMNVCDDLDSCLDEDERQSFFDMLGFSPNSAEAKRIFAPFSKKEYEEVLLHLAK